MSATVDWPLRTREVKAKDENVWLNREGIPLLRQMRQALNYTSTSKAVWLTNASAVFETMWTSDDIAVGTAVRIDVNIVAVAVNDRSIFTLTGLFFNNGTTQQEPATVFGPLINAAGWVVRFHVAANHVELQVEDAGSVPVQWVAIVTITGAP